MSSTLSSTASEIISNAITTIDHRVVDDAAVQQAVEEVAAIPHTEDRIKMANSMKHDISHGEPVSTISELLLLLPNGFMVT